MNNVDFEDLIISEDDKNEIRELISAGKNPGLIGFDGGINPDIFDRDQCYSNVENVLNALKNYDFLILKTNKKRLVTLPVKYFTCFEKDLIFVSKDKEDVSKKIKEVFEYCNLRPEALDEIVLTYPIDEESKNKLEKEFNCRVRKTSDDRGDLIIYDETFELLKRGKEENKLKITSYLTDSPAIVVPKDKIVNYKNEPDYETRFFTYESPKHLKKLLSLSETSVILTKDDQKLLKEIVRSGLEPEIDVDFLNKDLLKLNIVTTKRPVFKTAEDLKDLNEETPLVIIDDQTIFTTAGLFEELENNSTKILVGEEDSEIIGEYFFL